MKALFPQSTVDEKEEFQPNKRAVIKQPPPEASLGTPPITGVNERNIATLAYALYELRGRVDGYDLKDWLEAEQRLMSHAQDRGF